MSVDRRFPNRSAAHWPDGAKGAVVEIRCDVAAILRWTGLFVVVMILTVLAIVRPHAILTLGCAAGAATGRPCPAQTISIQPPAQPRRPARIATTILHEPESSSPAGTVHADCIVAVFAANQLASGHARRADERWP